MRSRVSFANVVSCIALFVALGGTSYAVIKLPRNSVGSREVKNGTLRTVDLASGVLPKSLRGPRGPEGPAGSAGAGGQRGPSDVITAQRGAVSIGLAGPTKATDVVTINVPAGSWWVLGSASGVYNGPGSSGTVVFICNLMFGAEAGAASADAVLGEVAGGAQAGNLTVHEGRVLSGPTAVRLRCRHDGDLAGGNPRVDFTQLTAIRTDNLQIQPG